LSYTKNKTLPRQGSSRIIDMATEMVQDLYDGRRELSLSQTEERIPVFKLKIEFPHRK